MLHKYLVPCADNTQAAFVRLAGPNWKQSLKSAKALLANTYVAKHLNAVIMKLRSINFQTMDLKDSHRKYFVIT